MTRDLETALDAVAADTDPRARVRLRDSQLDDFEYDLGGGFLRDVLNSAQLALLEHPECDGFDLEGPSLVVTIRRRIGANDG